MNYLSFGAKRVFYGNLKVERKALRVIGEREVTSARHIVMSMLLEYGDLMQHHLQRALGCVSSTLSRMLKVLEGLGFVVRERPPEDRRLRIVRLTQEGWEKLRSVERRVDDAIMTPELDVSEDPFFCPVIPGTDGRWAQIVSASLEAFEAQETPGEYLDRFKYGWPMELGLAWGPYPPTHPDH